MLWPAVTGGLVVGALAGRQSGGWGALLPNRDSGTKYDDVKWQIYMISNVTTLIEERN